MDRRDDAPDQGARMNKFLILYRSSASAAEQMAGATPEQMKAGMDAWMSWAARAGAAIVDLGSPVAPPSDAGDADETGIGGFSILQAESVDEIHELLEDHPHLNAPDASIEVREFLTMPGM
jgi:hypothetical protein